MAMPAQPPIWRRIYLSIAPPSAGRVTFALSLEPPVDAGAMVAVLFSKGVLHDNWPVEVRPIIDPSADPALRGLKGDPGASAYQIARDEGYGGTRAAWLASLRGAEGLSAYQVARANGYGGTETAWLASLKGADAMAPVLGIGTVSTLPAGSQATATLTGTAAAPKLNLGVPKGDTGAPGSTLIGTVTLAQTATVAIALGIREITVALAGAVKGGRYQAFVDSYRLNGGASVIGKPAGYAMIDCASNADGQVTISLNAPLLAVGSSYALTCSVVRINAA